MNWIYLFVYIVGFALSFWRFARVKTEKIYDEYSRFFGILTMSLFWPAFWLIIGLYVLMLKADGD